MQKYALTAYLFYKYIIYNIAYEYIKNKVDLINKSKCIKCIMYAKCK